MNVRIDWTAAPAWAKYLTRNPRGTYIWCESKPLLLAGELRAGRTQVAQEFWDVDANLANESLSAYRVCS